MGVSRRDCISWIENWIGVFIALGKELNQSVTSRLANLAINFFFTLP